MAVRLETGLEAVITHTLKLLVLLLVLAVDVALLFGKPQGRRNDGLYGMGGLDPAHALLLGVGVQVDQPELGGLVQEGVSGHLRRVLIIDPLSVYFHRDLLV